MRSAFGKFCFLIAAICVALLFVLPSGSPASLAPLAALMVFAPLSVALWSFNDRPALKAPPSIGFTLPTKAPAPRAPAALEPRKLGSVAKFMAERLTRADGESVSAHAVLKAYSQWCAENDLGAAEDFQQRLNDLCVAASIRLAKDGALLNIARI